MEKKTTVMEGPKRLWPRAIFLKVEKRSLLGKSFDIKLNQ